MAELLKPTKGQTCLPILAWGLALAVFTACEQSPPAPTAPPAQEDDDQLTVALTDVSLGKIPYIVAVEEGLFEKHGVNVDAYITAGAARTVDASGVQANPVFVRDTDDPPDVYTGGGAPMMVAYTTDIRRRDRVIVATTDQLARWWVLAKSEITTLEQLKGKRLGVSGYGTCTGFTARLIAQRMGWSPEQDLSILYGALGVRWLQEGIVDAIVADDTHYAYGLSVGFKPIVELLEWNEPMPCDSVVVARSWLDQPENRARLKLFLKALVEAISLMKKDSSFVYEAIEKWYNITDQQRQRTMYEGVQYLPAKPYPTVVGIQKVMELYDYHEMRQHTPEDFYDDSLMREIDESGFIDGLYD